MIPIVNLIYLTENLSMASVTGLKNRPKADYDAYMGKLDKEAAGFMYDRTIGNPGKGIGYDRKMGNPGMVLKYSEYSANEFRFY
ncbi:hypothetical protein DPMN_088874 [Dreissena polymorpha]|uniref:Uncharacterized protein n=1 Tax=Dreissena polymorpha TaxID=45954 RepID=A0A9D4QWT4_DREPO|nr:hypothetical protein DPMN_088874 [Dreissena polymorpha]